MRGLASLKCMEDYRRERERERDGLQRGNIDS